MGVMSFSTMAGPLLLRITAKIPVDSIGRCHRDTTFESAAHWK